MGWLREANGSHNSVGGTSQLPHPPLHFNQYLGSLMKVRDQAAKSLGLAEKETLLFSGESGCPPGSPTLQSSFSSTFSMAEVELPPFHGEVALSVEAIAQRISGDLRDTAQYWKEASPKTRDGGMADKIDACMIWNPVVPLEGPLDAVERRRWRLERQGVPSARLQKEESEGMDVHLQSSGAEEKARIILSTQMAAMEDEDMGRGLLEKSGGRDGGGGVGEGGYGASYLGDSRHSSITKPIGFWLRQLLIFILRQGLMLSTGGLGVVVDESFNKGRQVVYGEVNPERSRASSSSSQFMNSVEAGSGLGAKCDDDLMSSDESDPALMKINLGAADNYEDDSGEWVGGEGEEKSMGEGAGRKRKAWVNEKEKMVFAVTKQAKAKAKPGGYSGALPSPPSETSGSMLGPALTLDSLGREKGGVFSPPPSRTASGMGGRIVGRVLISHKRAPPASASRLVGNLAKNETGNSAMEEDVGEGQKKRGSNTGGMIMNAMEDSFCTLEEEGLAAGEEEEEEEEERGTINSLPATSLSIIFSFLTSQELVRASMVCRIWEEDLARGYFPGVLSFGDVFAGTYPPSATVFSRFAARLRGSRDLSFAGCTWLTGGSLLVALGVPVGVSCVKTLSPAFMQLADGDTGKAARQALAEKMSHAWKEGGGGGEIQRAGVRGNNGLFEMFS